MPRQRERSSPTFETVWPELAGQLRAQLARGGAPAWLIDDVIQDTALRLVQKWDGLDRDEPLAPWASTVARNVLVDHYRAAARLTDEEVPEIAVEHVEDAALARVELERVCKALGKLNPRYREVLLAEIGDPRGALPTSRFARNSARMRARRQLVAIMQAMRGVVTTGGLSLRRMWREFYVRAAKVRNTFALESIPQSIAGILVVAALVSGTESSALDVTDLDEVARATSSRIAFMKDGPSSSGVAENYPGMEIRLPRAAANADEPARSHGAGQKPASLAARMPHYEGRTQNWATFGPEGVDVEQDNSTTIQGHRVTLKYRHRVETPSCVQNVAEEKPPGTCEPGQGPSGYVEVGAAGQRRRVKYGDRND